MGYAISDHWDVSVGYRTIEGGADVEQAAPLGDAHGRSLLPLKSVS
ncbi:MAG: hypothetical protein LJF30_02015 [Acidobacteria bacterium]|nr:hypothetical protein [Acidobacteriota bacterium]